MPRDVVTLWNVRRCTTSGNNPLSSGTFDLVHSVRIPFPLNVPRDQRHVQHRAAAVQVAPRLA